MASDDSGQNLHFGGALWIDRVWWLATSRWAWLLGACWLLVLAIAVLVPQQGAAWTAYGTRVGWWLRPVQEDGSAWGAAVDALGLATIWRGWAVRALQGLTVAWLLLRLMGELAGWPTAHERSRREAMLQGDWPATQALAQRLAAQEGWRLVRGDDNLAVLRGVRPSAAWKRALAALGWVGLLLLVCGTWIVRFASEEGIQVPLAVGEQVRIGQWGVQQLWLDRLTLQTRADGTVKSLMGELRVVSLSGEERPIRLADGHATAFEDASLRVVEVGPAAKLSVATLDGEAVALAPMAGETAGHHVRLQLGGLSQEHLVALDSGRAVLRLLEGALAHGDTWALLVELLDGHTGELIARHEVNPPDQVLVGDWLVDLAPEYYVRLYVGPQERLLTLLFRWAWALGALLVAIGLYARRRWRPEVAVVVLRSTGKGAHCELIASSPWQEQLLAQLGGEADHYAL